MRRSFIALFSVVIFLFSLTPATSAPRELFVDVVSVQLPDANVDSKVSEVVNSLEEVSLPYWNKELRNDPRERRLVLGRVETRPISMGVAPRCDGPNIIKYIDSVKGELSSRYPNNQIRGRYLVIYIPRSSCVWEAISSLNSIGNWDGGMILNGNTKPFIISHELGHALGLGHSNLVACQNGKRDGIWGSECRALEYGGAVDLMSNVEVESPLNTYHRWRLGTIPNADVRVNWIDESISLRSTESDNGPRAIFMRDGSATYWLEYRSGLYGENLPGLVLYRTDPPPADAISSPNLDDTVHGGAGGEVSTDVWLINLNDYRYLNGKVAGSMTLNSPSTFTVHSGRINISVSDSSLDSINVKINRQDDLQAPPVPKVLDQSQWGALNSSILDSDENFFDKESSIVGYELDVNNTKSIITTPLPNWVPNYLNPLVAQPTVTVADLPEGLIDFRIRAIDAWGNKSDWTPSVRASIDRGFPVLNPDAQLSFSRLGELSLEITGSNDQGSGVCKNRFINLEGYVTAQSINEEPRLVPFTTNLSDASRFEAIDCVGNGVSANSAMSITELDLDKLRKSGKWTNYQIPSRNYWECKGRCSVSFSGKSNVSLISNASEKKFFLNGKPLKGAIKKSESKDVSVESLKIEKRSATIRITGNNLRIYRIVVLDWRLTERKEFFKAVPIPLGDEAVPGQSRLSKYGFRVGDFDENSLLAPLARGFTLEDATLDLCADKFTSDSGRSVRRQLISYRDSSPYSFLSTEVVEYQSQILAKSAFAELLEKIQECQSNSGYLKSDGSFERYAFLKSPQIGATVMGTNYAYVEVKIGEGNFARWLLAFYNFNGKVLSGLYVVKPTQEFTESQIKAWREVNSILVNRLEYS